MVSLQEFMLRKLKTGEDADVTFVLGSQKVKPCVMRAHSYIIERSEVMRRYVRGSFTEATERTVTLPDVKPKAFKCLLRYLYTDQVCINPLHRTHARSLLEYVLLAQRFEVPALRQALLRLLDRALDFGKNLAWVLVRANDLDVNGLREICTAKLEECWGNRVRHSDFKDCLQLELRRLVMLRSGSRSGALMAQQQMLQEALRLASSRLSGVADPCICDGTAGSVAVEVVDVVSREMALLGSHLASEVTPSLRAPKVKEVRALQANSIGFDCVLKVLSLVEYAVAPESGSSDSTRFTPPPRVAVPPGRREWLPLGGRWFSEEDLLEQGHFEWTDWTTCVFVVESGAHGPEEYEVQIDGRTISLRIHGRKVSAVLEDGFLLWADGDVWIHEIERWQALCGDASGTMLLLLNDVEADVVRQVGVGGSIMVQGAVCDTVSGQVCLRLGRFGVLVPDTRSVDFAINETYNASFELNRRIVEDISPELCTNFNLVVKILRIGDMASGPSGIYYAVDCGDSSGVCVLHLQEEEIEILRGIGVDKVVAVQGARMVMIAGFVRVILCQRGRISAYDGGIAVCEVDSANNVSSVEYELAPQDGMGESDNTEELNQEGATSDGADEGGDSDM